MTGCYRYIGRNCVPNALGDCSHYGCPVTERSTFRAERHEEIQARLRARRFVYGPHATLEETNGKA